MVEVHVLHRYMHIWLTKNDARLHELECRSVPYFVQHRRCDQDKHVITVWVLPRLEGPR